MSLLEHYFFIFKVKVKIGRSLQFNYYKSLCEFALVFVYRHRFAASADFVCVIFSEYVCFLVSLCICVFIYSACMFMYMHANVCVHVCECVDEAAVGFI